MRVLLLAAAFLVSGCASAVAQDDPIPLWRMDTSDLERDTQIARTCVLNNAESCDSIVQDECTGGDGGEGITPAVLRMCDWRAIAAWEDVSAQLTEDIRGALRGDTLEAFEASQTAWAASMLADVSVAMDIYEGGSLAGAVGAHVRAQAQSNRARYLADLRLQLGLE
jgi:hypothetical protein